MADLDWKDFAPSTFDAAKRANRPVLLVITMPWCPHCRDLLATTLEAPDVVRLVQSSFVPVHVDGERRPDVNERFGAGVWPTIAFLTPSGELLTNDGFLTAPELVEKLQKVRDYWARHSAEIEEGLRSLWERRESGEVLRLHRAGTLNEQIVEDVTRAVYERFDHRFGGWGETTKFAHTQAIDFALIQLAKRNDPRMREVVTVTLDRMRDGAIHDRIDGGFFRYSTTPDWNSPVHEKILDSNAMRLRCYLEAYQLLGVRSYRDVARGIVDWMLRFLLDDATGAFFGGQDADADYYALDREGRARRDSPRVDRTVFTNWNAMAVSSLFKASVVLEDIELRDRAMRTLRFLLDHLIDPRDGVYHYWDGSYHLRGLLSDQAYAIRALIDAVQHTGDSDLLLPAERIAEQAIERQKAPGGGFYDVPRDHRQSASMQRRNRSILENSVMAEALLRLSALSRRPEFHDVAVETLRAFTDDYKEYGYYVAGYGRAVDLIFYQPLLITIVGDRASAEADALRRAALTPYVPSRIVQMLDPAYDPILIGRSGFQVEEQPVAWLQLDGETRASARTPDELLAAIELLEQQRR